MVESALSGERPAALPHRPASRQIGPAARPARRKIRAGHPQNRLRTTAHGTRVRHMRHARLEPSRVRQKVVSKRRAHSAVCKRNSPPSISPVQLFSLLCGGGAVWLLTTRHELEHMSKAARRGGVGGVTVQGNRPTDRDVRHRGSCACPTEVVLPSQPAPPAAASPVLYFAVLRLLDSGTRRLRIFRRPLPTMHQPCTMYHMSALPSFSVPSFV